MVLGLMRGMSLTAYAATDTYTALKNNATVVQFNGYNWYIIEDNSTSATEGTVTLLAADNGFGLSNFSDSQSNAYSSSKIKVALDAMTAEGGAFAGVADAIADTDLADVSVTGAKLYLLSTSEAGNLNQTILGYNYPGADKGKWWLRSPGYLDGYAAFVRGDFGNVNGDGDPVNRVFGVRPALKLDLSKVTFDSTSKTFSLKPSHSVADSYTVTYDPGRGSGTMNPTTVRRTDEGKYPYTVENCGFTAPQGEKFDCWMGSNGLPYKPGATVELTGDLTLTALWKDGGGSGTQPQRRGGGLNGDLVFFGGSGADDGWEYIGGGMPQRAYRLSFAPMQGGSAYFALNSGETGETMYVYPQTTVWVRPTPAPGYRLASIVWSMIDGSASYDITEAQNFIMPAMDAVVYVTFQPVG